MAPRVGLPRRYLVLAGLRSVFQLLLELYSLTVVGVKVQGTAGVVVGLRALKKEDRRDKEESSHLGNTFRAVVVYVSKHEVDLRPEAIEVGVGVV